MATTDFGKLSTAVKKLWIDKLDEHFMDEWFWSRNGMLGRSSTDTGSIMTNVKEFTETERGDVAVMHLVPDLVDDGTPGDETLDGREEEMEVETQEIRIDQLRHGVRRKGRMAEQRTVVRFRVTARKKLTRWRAEILDKLGFLTVAGIPYTKELNGATRPASSRLPALAFAADVSAPTSRRKFFAGTATSTATLTASDTISWNRLIEIKAQARRELIHPVQASGMDTYVVCMSTEQARDLKKDPNYQTAVANAKQRGDGNPLFKNAFAYPDGLILYDHTKVPTTLGLASGAKWGASGTVDGAQALLLGAQAIGFANLGSTMDWVEDPDKDYKNKPGISVGGIFGFKKPKWTRKEQDPNPQDYGVISFYTAAAALT